MRNDRLCFFRREVSGTDDDVIAGLSLHIAAGKLNGRCFKTIRAKSVTHLFYRDILGKCQLQNGATCEINTPVETEEDDDTTERMIRSPEKPNQSFRLPIKSKLLNIIYRTPFFRQTTRGYGSSSHQ